MQDEIITRKSLADKFSLVLASHAFDPNPGLIGALIDRVPSGAYEITEFSARGEIYMVGNLDDDLGEGEIVGHGVRNAIYDAHIEAPSILPITLYISSDGGSVDLGMAIQSMIARVRRAGRKVNGHVMGCAFSSAFDILQHCDYRTAEATAGLMCHEEQFSLDKASSSGDHLREGRFSKKIERAQFQLFSRRTGKPVSYYEKMTAQEWYMTAQEALAEGLIDEIINLPELPTSIVEPPKPKRVRKPRVEPPPTP